MLSFVSGFLCCCWMLFRCVDVPHILFLPFLAPLFVYFERCCSEHSRTSLCVDLHFHFSWSCWLYSKSMFSFFFKKLSNCFQSGCTILHAHQQRVQVLASPCPWRHVMLPLFRVTVLRACAKRHLIVVCSAFPWPRWAFLVLARWPFICLLWWDVWLNLLSILKLAYFSSYWVKRDFCICWMKVLYRISDSQGFFLPVCGLSFHIFTGFFWRTEVFILKSSLSACSLLHVLLNLNHDWTPRPGHWHLCFLPRV